MSSWLSTDAVLKSQHNKAVAGKDSRRRLAAQQIDKALGLGLAAAFDRRNGVNDPSVQRIGQQGQNLDLVRSHRIGGIYDTGGTLTTFDKDQRGTHMRRRRQTAPYIFPPAQFLQSLPGIYAGGHMCGVGQGQTAAKRGSQIKRRP